MQHQKSYKRKNNYTSSKFWSKLNHLALLYAKQFAKIEVHSAPPPSNNTFHVINTVYDETVKPTIEHPTLKNFPRKIPIAAYIVSDSWRTRIHNNFTQFLGNNTIMFKVTVKYFPTWPSSNPWKNRFHSRQTLRHIQ